MRTCPSWNGKKCIMPYIEINGHEFTCEAFVEGGTRGQCEVGGQIPGEEEP